MTITIDNFTAKAEQTGNFSTINITPSLIRQIKGNIKRKGIMYYKRKGEWVINYGLDTLRIRIDKIIIFGRLERCLECLQR